MTESKYLLIPAEGDIDEDEGMTMLELFAAYLPNQMKAAARWRMMERLAAENFEGPLNEAAEQISGEIEDKHGDALSDIEKMSLLMGEMIARFPETK